MEKRREKLSTLKLCRFCLTESDILENLYERNQTSKDPVNLHLKILTCVSVEVFPSDKMPCYICNRCSFLMNMFYDYKRIVRQADEKILQYLQNGTALEAINIPPLLSKVFKSNKELGMMKTIVEGGATVQVTSQDISDSEEEENANVYNIKIGDGADGDNKTTCIKVVAANNSQETMEDSGGSKGFSSVTKLARHVRSHAGERPYPCKYCHKSFTKSHHYTRHLRVKHRNAARSSQDTNEFRCDQCDVMFNTQDELIYHSAIHATQNLTCPLCQEKFDDVDAVTTHIKSHVSGEEYMCDFCELVFTAKEKLDKHMVMVHEEELQQPDYCSYIYPELQEEGDMDVDEEDYDLHGISVKEIDENNTVIEIKKADEFMIKGTKELRVERNENTNSEESDAEMPPGDGMAVIKKQPSIKILSENTIYKPAEITAAGVRESPKQAVKKLNSQMHDFIYKEEEASDKVQRPDAIPVKKEKLATNTKVESSSGVGDKSLRLLEKELQDLKRTNSRNDVAKTPAKAVENLRSRRPQLHTSTPKLRSGEEKKPVAKPLAVKKVPTKENKEPKEIKESKNIVNEKEEKELPKSLVKNGSSDKSTDEVIRRSTRPSKIKNYAKMIRDKPQAGSDDDSEDDDDDEEYKEAEPRPRGRRSSLKQTPKLPTPQPAATPSPVPSGMPTRKRGRPRKDQQTVPAKMKKESEESEEEVKEKKDASILKETETKELMKTLNNVTEAKSPPVLVYPSGQTLKKVPVKALPPGVKPLPLPVNARPVATGDLCEMQIGKKVVKVQKIVMTRAEVEAMAKKGLVEMKDGTMVLKQGIKLPSVELANIKSTLVGDTSKTDISNEAVTKKEKGVPTRCDLEES